MPLLRKGITITFAKWVGFVLAVVTSMFLSRGLGPEGVGRFSLFRTIFVMTVALASLGIPSAGIIMMNREKARPGSIMGNGLAAVISSGLVISATLTAVILLWRDYFGPVPFLVALAGALFVPLVSVQMLFRSFPLARRNARATISVEISQLLFFSAAVALLFLTKTLDVPKAIVILSLSVAFACSIGIWINRSIWRSGIELDGALFRRTLKIGIQFAAYGLMFGLTSSAALLLIRAMKLEFAQVGYFSRGIAVARLVNLAGAGVLPLLLSRWSELQGEKLRNHAEQTIRLFACAVIPASLLIVFFGDIAILLLYGEEFLPAVSPMRILVAGTVLNLLTGIVCHLFSSQGHPWHGVLVFGCGLIVNLSTNLYLIPRFGIVGAAIGTLIGYISAAFLAAIIAKYVYKIRLRNLVGIRRSDIKFVWSQLKPKSRNRNEEHPESQ